MHIAAASPKRLPVFSIRVYPPGRSAILVDTSRNNSVTQCLSLRLAKTIRRECIVSSLDFVRRGSINLRSSLAFATVVVILLCLINEQAIFDNIAERCEAVRPK